MRKTLTFLFLCLAFIGATVAGPANAKPSDEKVTICHRTNADTNPYRQITVSVSAVDGKGGADHYGEHQGVLYGPDLKAMKIKWGDIIPPVGSHNGLNWSTDGIAIYENGCTIETSTPTTTTTVAPPPEEETTTTTVVELIPPLTLEREPVPAVPTPETPKFTG